MKKQTKDKKKVDVERTIPLDILERLVSVDHIIFTGDLQLKFTDVDGKKYDVQIPLEHDSSKNKLNSLKSIEYDETKRLLAKSARQCGASAELREFYQKLVLIIQDVNREISEERGYNGIIVRDDIKYAEMFGEHESADEIAEMVNGLSFLHGGKK